MTDQTSTLRIQADASGVEAGVATAKRSLASLGGAAAQAGKQGADGLAALGNGGDAAARKVDSATKSMVGSIQRQIAAMEAGGTSSRQYQESLAKLRGIDVSALKPYLDQLDAAKVKANAAAKATDGLKSAATGISGVSRAVDGVAQSLRSLAGVAAAGLSVRAFVQAADAVTILNNQLKLATGSAQAASVAYTALFDIAQRSRVSFTELGGTFASIARAGEQLGISQSRLLGVTESISNAIAIGGGSAESTKAALVQLGQGLSSGTLRGEELNSVMEQTPRLAKALADGLGITTGELRKMGEQGKITAGAVISALESQSKVLSGEVENSVVTVGQAFTQLQNSTVMAAGEFDKATGTSATLAKSIQGVADSVTAAGAAFRENETAIKTTVGALAGLASVAAVGGAARWVASIGGIGTALTAVGAVIAGLNPITLALLGVGAAVGAGYSYVDAQSKTIAGLSSELRNLERLNAQAANSPHDAILNANVKKRTAEIIRLRGELGKLQEAQRLADAPIGSVGSGDTALRREMARQGALNKPDNKAAGAAAAKALADQNRELAEQAKLLATLSGVNGDYQEQLTRLQVVRKSQNLSDARYSELVTELIDKQPMVKALYADQEKSAKAWADQSSASAKAVADLSKEYDAYVKTLDSAANAVGTQVQKLQDEETATIIAAQQNISLAQAIEQVTIARLEEAQTKAYANGDQEAGDAIKREIEARKKLATLIGGKEVREANKKAADDAAKEWQKTADKMSDSITDALMRGFENGKGIAENLRDTIENIFKTMVLRPVVQATVNGGLQALGIPGVGGSSGGAGGLLNAASNVNTLYGAATQYFTGASAGATAASLASANAVGLAGGDAIGALIAGNGGWAGVSVAAEAGAAAGAASGAAAAGTAAGGAAAGGAGALAAIPGWGWALGGALLLGSLFGGGSGKYVQSTGDAIRTYRPDGSLAENGNNGASWFKNTPGSTGLLDGLQAQYQQTAKLLDIGTVQTRFEYGSNDSNGGKFALGGWAGSSGAYQGETKATPEALQLAASRAVFAALQGSDLPAYLSKAFGSLTANTASQEQITAAYGFAESLKSVRFSLLSASEQMAQIQTDLDKGFTALGTSAATFKADFSSAIEAGITPESLANWQALGNSMTTLESLSGKAADGLTKISKSLTEIANERRSLQDQLDNLTMTSAQLLEKQRSALDESNRGLFDQVQAQLALRSANEQSAQAAVAAADAFKATVQTMADARAALLGTATTGAQDAFATLSRAVEAQRAQDAAAYQAQRAIATAAYTSQSEVYQQQIDATRQSLDGVGASVGKLQSLSGSLKSTLDGMRIAGSDGAYRADAQAQISAAVARARAGGGLPLDGQLASALATVSKPSEQLFGTFQDYARDFYKTANDIAALSSLTDAQLTADQVTQDILADQIKVLDEQKRTLKDGFAEQVSALDDILNNAQLQLDAANGLNVSVLSVADALNGLASAVSVLETTRAGQGLATTVNASTTAVSGQRQSDILQYLQGVNSNTQLSDFEKAQTVYTRAQIEGVTEAEIARAWGASAEETRRWFGNAGVPQFAVGTNYVPRDMLAQIHEGEAIVPKAYNPAANGAGGTADMARLEALVERLTDKVASLQGALDKIEKSTRSTDTTLRNVTPSGDSLQTVAA